MKRILFLSLASLVSGCVYSEDALEHVDMFGKVRLPKEAVQITLLKDGEAREIDDPRAIGPVYIGAFPSVQEGLYEFPHPEMGPVLDPLLPGNTYPYGGTTVGRFDWACYEALRCKMVTGRFESYDDVLEFWEDQLEAPVTAPDGELVGSGVEYQERCYELMYLTSDDEVSFVNEEVDFELQGDYYVADVELLHVLFSKGMAIWGWVDMPDESYTFRTCEETEGDFQYYYTDQYYTGTNNINLLNYPGEFIDEGDWVAEGVTVNKPDDEFVLDLGVHHE